MRALFFSALLLSACSGGGGDDGGSDPSGDDDDGLTPWSELETTQTGTCCHTVLPLYEVTTVEHEGFPAMWAVPENPVGALIVYHGTDGNLDSIQQVEWVELYNLLYPRGIAIIATVSSDRDVKQWDTTPIPDNVDYPRVQSLLSLVAQETPFEADMPLVSIGFSQGCSMSHMTGELGPSAGQNAVGVVLHNCQRVGPPNQPVLFVDARNDWQAEHMAETAAAHPDGTLLQGHEVALDPLRFAKFDYFSQDDSQKIFDELVGMGVVDTDGVRAVEFGEDPEETVLAIEDNLQVRFGTGDIAQQLRVVWSMHRLSAENKVAEAQWIEAQILGQ